MEIVDRLKRETNNLSDIIYRRKKINGKTIYVIYNEPLISSDKVSDFIIRSLTYIGSKKTSNLYDDIKNNISNFKYKEVKTYEEICKYLHKGFCVIIVEGESTYLVLETKGNLSRSVDTPSTENTIRGSKDAFVEDYQKNVGLIKKRIKTNDLWIDEMDIGKYTNTHVGVMYINGIVKKELVNEVIQKLKKIDIYGIINIGTIKNLIQKEEKSVFPTTLTTERPDLASLSLLEGKIVIVIDNSPFVLIIPGFLNDFFKTTDDLYGKGMNVTFIRILKYMAFFISLLTPAVYIALITYNQEIIPTELLINFSMQRNGVPFPAFFEAFIMVVAFEILRESDLRVPSWTGSSLSIVGALILGDAAVSAGIVSPIMIIVIAITSICSLLFVETELVNGLRWYRLLFMLGASLMGVVGVVVVLILFLIKISSLESFGKPYLLPYVPTVKSGLKDSIIKFRTKLQKQREPFLSDNIIKQRSAEDEN